MKRYGLSKEGFSLVELVIVIMILTIMSALVVPSYNSVKRLIDRAACILNQRHITDAVLVYYDDRPFVTDEDGFGDGEVFIDLDGVVVGDVSRDLSRLLDKRVFDCPSDGLKRDGTDDDPDYITDGTTVTCLNDNCTAKKYGGTPFVHDIAKKVLYKHSITSTVALGSALPPVVAGGGGEAEEEEVDDEEEPPAYLSEDFDEGAEDRWKKVEGSDYEFGDGYLKMGSTEKGGGEHRIFAGEESWTDYTVEVTATLDEKSWGYGIYFRATDPENANAYVFQYDERYGSGAFLFRKIVNGNEQSPFARVYVRDTSFGKDFDWYDTERKIKIEVVGDEYRAYVDRELVVVGTDDSYENGMIGLRTWNKSSATFDSIEVKEYEETAISSGKTIELTLSKKEKKVK
jgi:prepilin-type N-terminal cleavage/methylation domain-containing protein